MPRAKHKSLDADFDSVLKFLQQRGLLPKAVPQSSLSVAKNVHRSTYSLILWRFRLTKLPHHGQVFIEELGSDALQVLPQIMAGYNKSAMLLMRGVVENTIKHIYFIDHPVEFTRMHGQKKWYIPIAEIFDYIKHHPEFEDTRDKFDAVANLISVYAELSEFVHGGTLHHLEMKIALEQIAFDATAANKQERLLQRVAESVNFLLAEFHHVQMARLDKEDRSLILSTMCATAKRALKGI